MCDANQAHLTARRLLIFLMGNRAKSCSRVRMASVSSENAIRTRSPLRCSAATILGFSMRRRSHKQGGTVCSLGVRMSNFDQRRIPPASKLFQWQN